MGIFNLFKKKGTNDSKANAKRSSLETGIFFGWGEREEYEYNNYLKSIKRPIEESFISNSEFFKSATCPYCGFKLEKSPSKKTKCKNCHNYIYVRTNLITKEKMLLTEDQIKELDKEREEIAAKVHALETALSDYDTWMEFKKVKKQLSEENKNLKDFDIIWGILNKQQIEYARQNNWGLFRNSHYGMFAILNAEKRVKEALEMLLEVCYYDINGPNNLSATNGNIFKDFPPFDLKSGFTAPGLVSSIKELKEQLNLQWDDVKNGFIERATKVRIKTMPLSPEKAWEILYDDLYNGQD